MSNTYIFLLYAPITCVVYYIEPCLLKKAERSLRYHVKENYQNTRIVNEQMVL